MSSRRRLRFSHWLSSAGDPTGINPKGSIMSDDLPNIPSDADAIAQHGTDVESFKKDDEAQDAPPKQEAPSEAAKSARPAKPTKRSKKRSDDKGDIYGNKIAKQAPRATSGHNNPPASEIDGLLDDDGSSLDSFAKAMLRSSNKLSELLPAVEMTTLDITKVICLCCWVAGQGRRSSVLRLLDPDMQATLNSSKPPKRIKPEHFTTMKAILHHSEPTLNRIKLAAEYLLDSDYSSEIELRASLRSITSMDTLKDERAKIRKRSGKRIHQTDAASRVRKAKRDLLLENGFIAQIQPNAAPCRDAPQQGEIRIALTSGMGDGEGETGISIYVVGKDAKTKARVDVINNELIGIALDQRGISWELIKQRAAKLKEEEG